MRSSFLQFGPSRHVTPLVDNRGGGAPAELRKQQSALRWRAVLAGPIVNLIQGRTLGTWSVGQTGPTGLHLSKVAYLITSVFAERKGGRSTNEIAIVVNL